MLLRSKRISRNALPPRFEKRRSMNGVAPCHPLRLVVRERRVEIDPNALDQGLAFQDQ
jgi:hypothetical protein